MNKKEQAFVVKVWDFYRANGRAHLPWRKTHNPYHILVSEIMLQQTQVDRVLPKYQSFIKKWPTGTVLAAASLGEVLQEWQGLGYNRRAKFLHECAKQVVERHSATFPKTVGALLELPGIGPYTAGAIMAFAYNQPVPIIETNIRTVYLHHFFKHKAAVSDGAILQLVQKTLPSDNPREWYAALMDYGTFLKQAHKVKNTNSKQYVKQSAFQGSNRQIRGAIVRLVAHKQKISAKKVAQELSEYDAFRVEEQLQKVIAEGLLETVGRSVRLPV